MIQNDDDDDDERKDIQSNLYNGYLQNLRNWLLNRITKILTGHGPII